MEIIMEGYVNDEKTKLLYYELSICKTNDHGFALVDGIIRFQGMIWLGNHIEAQEAVLTTLHSSGLGGHSGIFATYQNVKQMFSWPSMKHAVANFVQKCTICQQAKAEHTRLPGKL
jgi:hypothetical protein